jgi:hypothetical protein
MACAICQTRRPRRYCPGVSGDICSICCGTEREVTVTCPLDCPFLREARKHDRPVPIDPHNLPNRDIKVSEEVLAENETLFIVMIRALLEAAVESPEPVDADMREALEASIRTWRTMIGGIYYETIPENTLAARVCRRLRDGMEAFRKEESEKLGVTKMRDSTVLSFLVFLQHLELDRNNGRPRGRAFIDSLMEIYSSTPGAAAPPPTSLILP